MLDNYNESVKSTMLPIKKKDLSSLIPLVNPNDRYSSTLSGTTMRKEKKNQKLGNAHFKEARSIISIHRPSLIVEQGYVMQNILGYKIKALVRFRGFAEILGKTIVDQIDNRFQRTGTQVIFEPTPHRPICYDIHRDLDFGTQAFTPHFQ